MLIFLSSLLRLPKWGMRTSMVLSLLMSFVSVGLPHFVAAPTVRNFFLNASLAGLGVKAEIEAASIGWFLPTSVKGLRVVSADGHLDIRAEELRISQPWWQLVMYSDQLGHLEVAKPSVTLSLDPSHMCNFSLCGVPACTAHFQDGQFTLKLAGFAEPVIAVTDLSADIRITHGETSYLIVERGLVIDHCPLTAEMCDGLLQLLDPTLREVVQIEGNFSLDVQWLRLALDVSPAEQMQLLEFAGVLDLHEFTIKAKTPLLKRIVRVAADLYGKQPSDTVRIVKDNPILLKIRHGRIHYDDLVLGFPDLSPDLKIYSSGSFGFDKSLDLQIAVPEVLVSLSADIADPTAVVHFHVSGTLDDPTIERLPAPAALH